MCVCGVQILKLHCDVRSVVRFLQCALSWRYQRKGRGACRKRFKVPSPPRRCVRHSLNAASHLLHTTHAQNTTTYISHPTAHIPPHAYHQTKPHHTTRQKPQPRGGRVHRIDLSTHQNTHTMNPSGLGGGGGAVGGGGGGAGVGDNGDPRVFSFIHSQLKQNYHPVGWQVQLPLNERVTMIMNM